jgi:endoglucanase
MKHNFTFFLLFLIIVLFLSAGQNFSQDFVKVSGTKYVNQNGQEVYLKGMGLGGWLEPEGYMFGMSGFANSPSQIQKKIQDLIGTDNTNAFYSAFRKNFVTGSDINALATWGFNLVRLPFHYNILTPPDSPGVYLESGFAIFDSLISWCKTDHIYIILDMHCAPGGESDQTISDYDPSIPSLWQDTAKQTRTVDIWKTIAERYKNEPTIAGYDLLNEPRWDFPNGNQPLRDLYVRITNAIRSVDTTHILFIEGNQYATDFSGLTPPWDTKMAYSFHKYWNTNNINSIQGYLNLRNTYNVPLWLGESGENSNTWYSECITLMQQYDVSWSWWTLKKFSTINAPLNVPITADYQQL